MIGEQDPDHVSTTCTRGPELPDRWTVPPAAATRPSRSFHTPVPGAEWRRELRRRGTTARGVLKRHPWAVGLMDSRRHAGLETLAHHDAVIGCLREAGFSLALTGHAFAVLDAHLYGFLCRS